MTGQTPSRTSEFTWYSRLAAWIGAAMLLVQSVLGRDAGPVTVLAVLLLGVGFLCFLIGLAVDSRLPGTQLLIGPGISEMAPQPITPPDRERLPVGSPSAPTRPKAASKVPHAVDESDSRKKPEQKRSAPAATSTPPVQGPGRRPKFRERTKRSELRPERPLEKAPEPAPHQEPPSQPPPTPVEPVPAGVATQLLGPGDAAVGAECPRCGEALRLGQLAARCPVCGRTNHAVCWMENHFHCGTSDCTGHGSLEAPSASAEPERLDR